MLDLPTLPKESVSRVYILEYSTASKGSGLLWFTFMLLS